MNQVFLRGLIKGKVAELIFEEMFREAGKFNVLRLGTEYTLPLLIQAQRTLKLPAMVDDVRHTPDFLLISHDQTEAFFVEVKYRLKPQASDMEGAAAELLKRWHSPWLFLATPTGFYFAPCHAVVKERGEIRPLGERWIAKGLQGEYLRLLQSLHKGTGVR